MKSWKGRTNRCSAEIEKLTDLCGFQISSFLFFKQIWKHGFFLVFFFPDHRNNQNIHCKDFKHWYIDRKQKFPIIPLVCISPDFCPHGLVDMFKTVETTFCLFRFTTSVFYLMFSSLFHVIPCACVDFILFLFLLLSPEICTCEEGPIQSKSPPPTSQPLCLFGWTHDVIGWCPRSLPPKCFHPFTSLVERPYLSFGHTSL